MVGNEVGNEVGNIFQNIINKMAKNMEKPEIISIYCINTNHYQPKTPLKE